MGNSVQKIPGTYAHAGVGREAKNSVEERIRQHGVTQHGQCGHPGKCFVAGFYQIRSMPR